MNNIEIVEHAPDFMIRPYTVGGHVKRIGWEEWPSNYPNSFKIRNPIIMSIAPGDDCDLVPQGDQFLAEGIDMITYAITRRERRG